MSKDEIIMKLVRTVVAQEQEIYELRRKIEQVKKYIEVYEEYIKGE